MEAGAPPSRERNNINININNNNNNINDNDGSARQCLEGGGTRMAAHRVVHPAGQPGVVDPIE